MDPLPGDGIFQKRSGAGNILKSYEVRKARIEKHLKETIQNSSRNSLTQRSDSVPGCFLTLRRSFPFDVSTGVLRHSEGVLASCRWNSSVAQICPGSTCGSTRAAQSTASPPAITLEPSFRSRRILTSP